MSNIIVVFPKRENAVNIRNSLVRAGIEVSAVCLTGAKVCSMLITGTMELSCVVIGFKICSIQIYENLFRIRLTCFLVASADKWMDGLPDGVVGLPLPIKVYDLVNTVEMIQQTQSRKRRKRRETIRKRDDSQRKIIDRGESASDRTK